jgi:hypothetical protein
MMDDAYGEKRMNVESYEIEKEAIRKAILDYYHEGHVKSDPKLYKQVLHPEWRFALLNDEGQFWGVDRTEYCSWYDPKEVDPELEWQTEFYSIDVSRNIGAVKLRLECQKVRYIDYFHMMKVDGRWWIVHKISHGTQKGG